jgi:hypothetical protein
MQLERGRLARELLGNRDEGMVPARLVTLETPALFGEWGACRQRSAMHAPTVKFWVRAGEPPALRLRGFG